MSTSHIAYDDGLPDCCGADHLVAMLVCVCACNGKSIVMASPDQIIISSSPVTTKPMIVSDHHHLHMQLLYQYTLDILEPTHGCKVRRKLLYNHMIYSQLTQNR